MSARHRRHGFTLMEVLVALALLSTALFILMNGHYSAMRLHADSATEAEERQLLESAVSRAEVAVMLGTLGAQGDFGANHPDYSWSFSAQMVGPDQLVPLYQVTASLNTPEGEKSMDFFYFYTGASEATGGGELTGESSIKRGAASSGLGSRDGMRQMGSGSGGGNSVRGRGNSGSSRNGAASGNSQPRSSSRSSSRSSRGTLFKSGGAP